MGRTCCVQKLFWMSKTISVHNAFSPGLSLEFSCIEPIIQWTNLSSYCGLVGAKIRASDKDLPVWTPEISRTTVHYIILFINSRSKRTLETVTNLHETKNKRSSTIHLWRPRTDSRSKWSLLLNKSKESIQNYKTSYEWHKLKQEIRAQSPFVKQLEKNKTKTFSTKLCVWWKKEWWYTTGDQKKRRKPKN